MKISSKQENDKKKQHISMLNGKQMKQDRKEGNKLRKEKKTKQKRGENVHN